MHLNSPVLRIAVALGTTCVPGVAGNSSAHNCFEPNRGQVPPSIRFVYRGAGYAAALNEDGSAVYALGSASGTPGYLRMKLLDARARPPVEGEGALPSVTRYYQGGQGGAVQDIPHFSRIRYRDVYPGVDFLWYSHGSYLEYEFRLAPGANPRAIRMGFGGHSSMGLAGNGDLIVRTASGNLRYRRPHAWQESGGRRVPVEAAFRVESGVIGFDLGSYDARRDLVIDPVLEYSTYVGGAGFDAAYAIASDSAGNAYITGETASFDFPLTGTYTGVRSTRVAFVTKLSADGSQVLFTTILASKGSDSGRAIALDGSGNIWFAGTTTGTALPVTSDAMTAASNGGQDAFVARLDSGGQLTYATYLGGSGVDAALGIAVDAAGSVYVAGYTESYNFPTTNGAPSGSLQGGYDAFLTKLTSAGTLSYSTLAGGAGTDIASGVAVDANGNACFAGSTSSSTLSLRNAVQTSYGGNGDILLGCLNSYGTAWNVLTYLGGSGPDAANGIALDFSGNIYLTGDTYSPNFPVSGSAYQKTRSGDYDAFIVKLNAGGTAVVFATLLGGSASDSGTAIAVDSSNRAWIAGYTASAGLPVTDSSAFRGYFDCFVAEFGPDGSTLEAAGYLGGVNDDRCFGIALTSTGGPIVTGYSGSTDFPTTSGAVQGSAIPQGFRSLSDQLTTSAGGASIPTAAQSITIISRTSSSKPVLGFQPNRARALAGFPSSR